MVTISIGTFTYSGKVPLLNFTNNSGLAKCEIADNLILISVGEYNSIQMRFSHLTWNTSVSVPCKYSITPAPLTVIANNATKVYGSDNPDLTCSYFGFKNGGTEEVLTHRPIVETTATPTSAVGAYPIIPYGAEAQNYIFNYERGTLTIEKANQTIEWDQQFGTATVGEIVELTASSSSGLPIKYISSDETVAEVFTQTGKQYVEFLKTGNVIIRATQEGNENYNEADRISKSIEVSMLNKIDDTQGNVNNLYIDHINDRIIVHNAPANSAIPVFNLQGSMLAATTEPVIDGLAKGTYIISVGGKSFKVAL